MSRRTRKQHLQACQSLVAAVLLAASLAACRPDASGNDAANAEEAGPGTTAQAPPVALEDVMESGDGYIIGISYPRSVAAHPGLASALAAYAGEARDELMQALRTPEADGGDPTVPGPYDLSLAFVELHATPDLVAVAADGSSYLGGAHGQPLVRRFVWLPREGRMLTARELVPGDDGWRAIAAYVREQLSTAQSFDAGGGDGDTPGETADATAERAAMIEAGTEPDPENFSEFEPIARADGSLSGLRFVFPPYQVGPYADGTQSVDVPASVLLPHVAPAYRGLFSPDGTVGD